MEEATPESWRPAPGYEGWYEVSDHGRVRRVAPGRGVIIGRVLKTRLTDSPAGSMYPELELHRGNRASRRHVKVHRLVAEAFLGPPPPGHECNHKDADKTNCHASNLEWVTKSENWHHALRLGLLKSEAGECNGNAKLTWRQVEEIRALRGKETQKAIAIRFGVSVPTIAGIQRGRTWRSNPDASH